MNIVLIGYGKMGRTIHRLVEQKEHKITGIIDIDTSLDKRREYLSNGDVAIEFSHPDAAYNNIKEALEAGVPVVSGTTGWLSQMESVKSIVEQKNGAFFYASNFSIGVNILFAINEKLARIMDPYSQYEVNIDETHHIHKKDAPSGTAITLAEGVLNNLSRKSGWQLEERSSDQLQITSFREGEVFGKHIVRYKSDIDTIELMHDAHSRDGFALGAITAASWLSGRKGIYTMKDMMGL